MKTWNYETDTYYTELKKILEILDKPVPGLIRVRAAMEAPNIMLREYQAIEKKLHKIPADGDTK